MKKTAAEIADRVLRKVAVVGDEEFRRQHIEQARRDISQSRKYEPLIGGLSGGFMGAVGGNKLVKYLGGQSNKARLGGILGGAALGGTLGGLLGKHYRDNPPDITWDPAQQKMLPYNPYKK